MVRAYVSVGSNVRREHNVRLGVSLLRRQFGALELSRVYESEPVGFDGARFLNLVAGFDTDRTLDEVVDALRDIESACGRRRDGNRFSPRTMDVDLLLFGERVSSDGRVELPRAEITTHAFVLRPLADVAGERRHPVLGRTYGELWQAFDREAQPLWPVAFSFAPESS